MITSAPTVKKIPTTIPIDIFEQLLSNGKHDNSDIIQALEDVRAEITENIETIIGKYDSNTKPENMPSRKIERNYGRLEAIDIINRKIKEVKHE